jgi:hypothetical protein
MSQTENITMSLFADSRDCILQVHTFGDYIHQSWALPNDRVISFENIPYNYPSGTMCVWDSLDDYIEAIAKVDWLNDPDYIVHHQLHEHGFPFYEEEEDDETLHQAPTQG